MAKEKQIQPVVRQLTEYESGYIPIDGQYHMVSVDKDGNEVPGSDFSVGEKTYKTSYEGNAKFKVKKSPVQ